MDEQKEMTRHERRMQERAEKDRQRVLQNRNSPAGKILGTVVVLAVIGLVIWAAASKSASTNTTNPTVVRAEDHVSGPTDAAVTLIEYSDFQCPACAAYFPVLKQLKEAFPKDLRTVYRHFPLTQIHLNAFEAALASEAADKQGKFWEMHDILFARQTDWSNLASPESKFLEYARELGLDETKFKADKDGSAAKDRVKADQSLANRQLISSTPTFYVNGVKLSNPQGFEPFKAAIQNAINNAPKPSPTTP